MSTTTLAEWSAQLEDGVDMATLSKAIAQLPPDDRKTAGQLFKTRKPKAVHRPQMDRPIDLHPGGMIRKYGPITNPFIWCKTHDAMVRDGDIVPVEQRVPLMQQLDTIGRR
jgi:hypothetical protein